MTNFLRAFFLIFSLSVLSASVSAQKIGLVLSGGGAKGLAHVGVIKALEENEIPIDYVVGTSMGGIVGGLYAAGFSADEIEYLVLSQDFQKWVSGQKDGKYNYYFSTKEENASWLGIDLSVDSTFSASFKSNLASDLSLNYALAEQLAQSSQIADYNFDSLLVPFRTVAADIFTQEQVVFESGTLNQALRATMTVPFFYRPIKINGKYMFDGGVYNNFPVDIMQNEFDPDIIIGVNVSSKTFSEYPYDEDDELLSESLLYMFLDKSDPEAIDSTGVYIEPNLRKYTALDFVHANAILDSGYVSAKAQIEEVKNKIKERKACEDLATDRNMFFEASKPLLFSDIKMIGFSKNQQYYLRKMIDPDDKELYLSDIKKGYFKIISDGFFKSIHPNIVFDKASETYILELYGQPEELLKLEIGGNLATRRVSQIFLGLQYSRFRKHLNTFSANAYTGRFYQSGKLSYRVNFAGKTPFYIEPSFVLNQWKYLNADDIFFDDSKPIVLDQIDRSIGLNVGMAAGTRGKMVIGANYFNNRDNYSNTSTIASNGTLDELNLTGVKLGIGYERNSLNRKQYASEGDAFSVSGNYIWSEEEYFPGSTSLLTNPREKSHSWYYAKVSAEQYFPLNNSRLRYGYLVESVVSNHPFFSNYTGTLINTPSFYPLNDSKTLFLSNLKAFSYAAAGLRGIYSLKNNLDVRLEAHLFMPFRELTETQSQSAVLANDFSKFYLSAGSNLVFHSPIGPVSLSVNYYDDPNRKVGVLLHIGYLIFNKRSLHE